MPGELTLLSNWIKLKHQKPSIRDCPVEDEIKLKHLKPVLPPTQVKESQSMFELKTNLKYNFTFNTFGTENQTKTLFLPKMLCYKQKSTTIATIFLQNCSQEKKTIDKN